MRCLDDLDPAAGLAVAVARHHQAFERMRPLVLDRLGHGRTRLAGADDDGAAPTSRTWRLQFRDVGGKAGRGTRCGKRRVEQVA
jgi:hypothetical protein